jgi:chromosome segregation ATPase
VEEAKEKTLEIALDLNKRVGLIEERVNSLESDLHLLFQGTEDIKLRRNRLEAELAKLEKTKEDMERELTNINKKLKDTGIFVEDVTQKKNELIERIEELDRRLDKIKISKLVIPFVACLVVIIVIILLYLLLVIW